MVEAAPATPAQIAMYGHIAAALRQFVATKGWTMAQFNKALGHPAGHTSIYHWLGGKGGPGPEARRKLVKLTGIAEADLTARKPGQTALVATSPRPVSAARVADVLSFAVTADGEARIRLDITLPLATATPLLRMILDAGIVFGESLTTP